jgi:hypothetical protein
MSESLCPKKLMTGRKNGREESRECLFFSIDRHPPSAQIPDMSGRPIECATHIYSSRQFPIMPTALNEETASIRASPSKTVRPR